MKAKLVLVLMVLMASIHSAEAQLQPLPPPVIKPVGVRMIRFTDVLIGKWVGARLWENPDGSVNVDTLRIEFRVDGTFSFKHQTYEFNGPKEGKYILSGNNIKFSTILFPFSHVFIGAWDVNTGVINGTFKEVKSVDPNQPTYFKPGTNTGTFNLKRV